MSSDLWTEASYDAEAETRTRNLEMAKHATSSLWAFLAMASSPEEYADRLALATEPITAHAATAGVPLEDLLAVFDHRFALLMEAKDNPFADDSQDDSGDDDKESKDDDSDDSDDDGDDKSDSNQDDSNNDGHDDDSDSDEDSDDTGDGDDEDDDSNSDDNGKDDNGDSAPPWASKFSALAARIQAGENPLEWSDAAPFVRSSARVHAADGAEPVTDTNTPQGPDSTPGPANPPGPDAEPGSDAIPGPGAPTPPNPVPGMDGGIAETTKPRQLPEDGGTGPGMGMDGITGEFDPDTNGGDIEQGADGDPPGSDFDDSSKTAMHRKIAAIAFEVKRYNPTLSGGQCYKVAQQVYDTYLSKHAEDVNPLLYGDRGAVGDGPLSGPLKNWSPADFKPKTPTGGGLPKPPEAPGTGETPATPSGSSNAAAGELTAGEGAASDLLPLLAL